MIRELCAYGFQDLTDERKRIEAIYRFCIARDRARNYRRKLLKRLLPRQRRSHLLRFRTYCRTWLFRSPFLWILFLCYLSSNVRFSCGNNNVAVLLFEWCCRELGDRCIKRIRLSDFLADEQMFEWNDGIFDCMNLKSLASWIDNINVLWVSDNGESITYIHPFCATTCERSPLLSAANRFLFICLIEKLFFFFNFFLWVYF